MSAASVAAGRLDIGRVVSRTFAVVGREGVKFYLLALVLGALPVVLTQWVRLAITSGAPSPIQNLFAGLAGFVLGLASLAASVWLQAALFKGTVEAIDGRIATFGDLLRNTIAVILPLAAVAILNALGLMVGFVLLIVPGLIFVTMWAVVAPVAALERPGVFNAFGVSARLTKGRRWTVFGLLLLAGLAFGLVGGLVQWIVASLFYGVSSFGLNVFVAAAQAHGPSAYVGVVVSALIRASLLVVLTVGIGVLYYDLRALRDGEAPEDLATVFA